MVKTRIGLFLALILLGTSLFAQESQEFELTGKLNPDPNRI